MKTSLLLATLCILSSCTTTETKVQHVEVMTFRLTNPALDQDFATVNKEVNTFLKKQPGFISRDLGKCNDSTWIDVLRWESIKHFEAAYAKSAEDQGVKKMSAMIDFNTVVPLSFNTY